MFPLPETNFSHMKITVIGTMRSAILAITSTTGNIQAAQATSPKSSGKEARSSALEERKKPKNTMELQ